MSYPPQPAYGPPGGPPPGGYGAPVQNQSNGLAIAALVVGILSILCAWPLGIVAVALGIAGLSRAKKLNGVGKGQAIAGIITGAIGIIISIALLFLLVLAGDEVTDAASCLADRTELTAAASTFQAREGRPPNDESELVDAGDLDAELDTYDVEVSGNTFNVVEQSGGGC